MAARTIFILLALYLCVHSNSADVEYYNGENAEYNAKCAHIKHHGVASFGDPCRPNSYIMCTNGEARASTDCPHGQYFNPQTGWCQPTLSSTTLPPSCAGAKAKKIIESCADINGLFGYIRSPVTCKKYITCFFNTQMEMECPEGTYFEPYARDCIALFPPYVQEFDTEALIECVRKDPYTTTITPSQTTTTSTQTTITPSQTTTTSTQTTITPSQTTTTSTQTTPQTATTSTQIIP